MQDRDGKEEEIEREIERKTEGKDSEESKYRQKKDMTSEKMYKILNKYGDRDQKI